MRTPAVSYVVGLLALLLSDGGAHPVAHSDSEGLEPCLVGERQIESGEVHTCTIQLVVGELLRAEVTHLGADVATILLAPDGDRLLRVDYPGSRRDMLEPLYHVARSAGDHRLEITLSSAGNNPGRYRLDLWQPHQADPLAVSRAAGVAAFASGRELVREARGRSLPANAVGWQEAAEAFKAAVEHWSAGGDRIQAAFAWEELARVQVEQKDVTGELESYRQAYEIFLEAEHPRLVRVAGYRGERAKAHGATELAVECFEEQVRATQRLGMLKDQATALRSVAAALRRLGREDAALNSYEQALRLYNRLGDAGGRAVTLGSIGRLFTGIGEHRRAINFLEDGLSLQERLDVPLAMAVTLNTLGDAERRLGRIESSLERFDRTLELLGPRHVSGESKHACRRRSVALLGKARVRALQGKALRTSALFGRALENIAECPEREPSDEAVALGARGLFLMESGQPSAALDDLRRALKLRQEEGAANGQASARFALAEAFLALDDLPQGHFEILEAIELVEKLWESKSSRPLRSAYLRNKQQYYDLYVEILMRLATGPRARELEALALHANGRRRSRTLNERLHTPAEDLPPQAPELRQREETLWRELLNHEQEFDRLVLTGQSIDPSSLFSQQLDRLYLLFDIFEIDAHRLAPEYRPRPPAPRLAAIQELLDEDTILLEYSLGERASFVWVVSRDSFSAHWLPPRSELEDLARQVHRRLLDERPREILVQRREQALAKLSAALFPPSVAAKLTSKRLAIVKDGAVHFVPFGVLPMPPGHPLGAAAPMITGHELVNLPSAGVLRQLRLIRPERSSSQPSLTVFADATYYPQPSRSLVGERSFLEALAVGSSVAETNERIEVPTASGVEDNFRDAWSVVEDAFIDFYPQLPASRKEGQDILRLAPGPKKGFFGTDVQRTNVLSEFESADYLHFAVHGYDNPVRPEHSGLVLSRFDADGQKINSLLSARDIHRASVVAELVVLSSCRSGRGREIRGEGLVGLTQAFLGAGAQRVVVSLWNIDDEATSEFMGHFYHELFVNHRSAAAALRFTQDWMRTQPRWHEPRFWAGFVLHGEWR